MNKKEQEIAEIEKQIKKVEKELSDNTIYQPENKTRYDQAIKRKKDLDKRLLSVTDEWEEAQEKLDKVSTGLS